MNLTIAAKNAALQGIADQLNVGNYSVLSLYVGAVLAAEFTLTNPVEDTIIDAVMTFNIPSRVIAIASGEITAANILDDSGELIAELDVDTELVLDNSSIYMGGYVTVTELKMGV